MVEFALVLPVFALLLFGLIDFGMAYQSLIGLRNGVNAGARVASVGGPVDPSCSGAPDPMVCTVGDRIGRLLAVQPNTLVVSVGLTGTQAGDTVTVTAQAQLESTTGITGPFLDGKHICSSSELRLEQDVSDFAGTYTYASGAWSPGGSVSC